MDELKEIYEIAGSDPKEVIARYGGNEEMLRRFLRLFARDDSFAKLQEALAAGNADGAFRAVHTLKGICANLGFARLHEKSSEMTELLRRGELDKAAPLFTGLEDEYAKVLGALNRYL